MTVESGLRDQQSLKRDASLASHEKYSIPQPPLYMHRVIRAWRLSQLPNLYAAMNYALHTRHSTLINSTDSEIMKRNSMPHYRHDSFYKLINA